MQFNQEYIKQLAEGKAAIQHTQKLEDFEILKSLLEKAYPYYKSESLPNSARYYFNSSIQIDTYGFSNLLPPNKKAIPLHDFVSPTKEEKATIESIDARLKRLEEIYNKQAAPVIAAKEEQQKAEWKVGMWVKDEQEDLGIVKRGLRDSKYIEIDNQNGNVYEQYEWCLSKPTEQEIETYLIGLAKQRYPVGSTFISVGYGIRNVVANHTYLRYEKGELLINKACAWYGGVWAEVLPQAKEELLVNIRGDQHGNHNFIQISNGLGGFTKEQAEHYQAIIKNALNGTN